MDLHKISHLKVMMNWSSLDMLKIKVYCYSLIVDNYHLYNTQFHTPYCQYKSESPQSIQDVSYGSHLPLCTFPHNTKDDMSIKENCCQNIEVAEYEELVLFEVCQPHSVCINVIEWCDHECIKLNLIAIWSLQLFTISGIMFTNRYICSHNYKQDITEQWKRDQKESESFTHCSENVHWLFVDSGVTLYSSQY